MDIYVLSMVLTLAGLAHRTVSERPPPNPEDVKAFTECCLSRHYENCDLFSGILKNQLPTLVKTACRDCTKEQKEDVLRYMTALNQQPDLKARMQAKYDPDGKYWAEFEKSKGVPA